MLGVDLLGKVRSFVACGSEASLANGDPNTREHTKVISWQGDLDGIDQSTCGGACI